MVASLSACGLGGEVVEPMSSEDQRRAEVGQAFGEGGLLLLGARRDEPEPGSGLGVNSFLWRASLDTIAFMPLVSADPFGGVIITDWYAPPEAPDNRFKATVYILGTQLRADGVRVSVFRQERGPAGDWQDVPVSQATATDLENQVLTRARELRIRSASG